MSLLLRGSRAVRLLPRTHSAAVWRGLSTRAGAGVGEDLDSDDDFKPQVKQVALEQDSIQEQIGKIVKETPIVLFMKGLPSAPQCGFSMRTVQALNAIGSEYKAFNVLSSNELREGIKTYSQWPTIPQLFVKGEFVGGCDIVTGMFESGELKTLLESAEPQKAESEK